MHNPHEYVSHWLHMSSATSLRCVSFLINVKDPYFPIGTDEESASKVNFLRVYLAATFSFFFFFFLLP